ncbi:hypothetical protein ABK040_006056 [Willaertia magna]
MLKNIISSVTTSVVILLIQIIIISFLKKDVKAIDFTVKVQGGSLARANDYPFLVSLQYRESSRYMWEHICGATIIDGRYVLTASHCVVDERNKVFSPTYFSIVIGTTKLSVCTNQNFGSFGSCQRLAVKKVNSHEKFDYNTVVNDIAVLELDGTIQFSSSVKRASIPAKDPAPGVEAWVSGWGLINDNGGAVDDLRVGTVPINTEAFCNELGLDMSNAKGQLCAGLGNGVDACMGDSGGPLFYKQSSIPTSTNVTKNNATVMDTTLDQNYIVCGVVSYGPSGCGTASSVNNRGVYTSVAHYRDWITSKMSGSTPAVGSDPGTTKPGKNNSNSLKQVSFLYLLFIIPTILTFTSFLL